MGNELNEKNCMNRIPWMLLELVYPIFMLILLGVASVVGLIAAATVDDGNNNYKRHCYASSILGLLDCVPWAVQACFQYSINRASFSN